MSARRRRILVIPKPKYIYEYDYDPQKNWTRQTVYRQTKFLKIPADTASTAPPAAGLPGVTPDVPGSAGSAPSLPADAVPGKYKIYTRQITYADNAFRKSSPLGTAPSADSRQLTSSAASTQPTTRQSDRFNEPLAGTFTATMGDSTDSNAFSSIMTLVLKLSGDFAMDNVMTDRTSPDGKRTNHASGHWTRDGQKLTLTVETGNGRPVAADDPQHIIVLSIENRGARLLPEDGAPFVKRAGQ